MPFLNVLTYRPVRARHFSNSRGSLCRILTFIGAALLAASVSRAEDLYIAQSQTATPTGFDCMSALPVTWLNSVANWGDGPEKVGPGDTVHLCGAFTFPAGSTGIKILGSGQAGHPIRIYFEEGAILQSPAFVSAIDFTRQSNLVIDGGPNGLIQNLLNGVSGQICRAGPCSVDQSSGGIVGGRAYTGSAGSSAVEIKNLTIRDIYREYYSRRTSAGANSWGIRVSGPADNILIHNNVVSDSRINIYMDFDHGSFDTIEIHHNRVFHQSWGITVANGTSDAMSATNVFIHDNQVSDWNDWNKNFYTYHSDGIMVFTKKGGPGIFDVYIYNNHLSGQLSAPDSAGLILTATVANRGRGYRVGDVVTILSPHPSSGDGRFTVDSVDTSGGITAGHLSGGNTAGKSYYFMGTGLETTDSPSNGSGASLDITTSHLSAGTAYIYCTYGGRATPSPTPNQSCTIFNNVLDGRAATNAAWTLSDALAGVRYFNNTIFGSPASGSVNGNNGLTPLGTGTVLKNNIFANWNRMYTSPYPDLPTTISESNYNVFYNCASSTAKCFVVGGKFYTYSEWRALGFDLHSATASDLALDSGFRPQLGSVANGLGTNLSALCGGRGIPGLGALCYDKAGTARPATGQWDAGAYQHASVEAPAKLNVVVR